MISTKTIFGNIYFKHSKGNSQLCKMADSNNVINFFGKQIPYPLQPISVEQQTAGWWNCDFYLAVSDEIEGKRNVVNIISQKLLHKNSITLNALCKWGTNYQAVIDSISSEKKALKFHLRIFSKQKIGLLKQGLRKNSIEEELKSILLDKEAMRIPQNYTVKVYDVRIVYNEQVDLGSSRSRNDSDGSDSCDSTYSSLLSSTLSGASNMVLDLDSVDETLRLYADKSLKLVQEGCDRIVDETLKKTDLAHHHITPSCLHEVNKKLDEMSKEQEKLNLLSNELNRKIGDLSQMKENMTTSIKDNKDVNSAHIFEELKEINKRIHRMEEHVEITGGREAEHQTNSQQQESMMRGRFEYAYQKIEGLKEGQTKLADTVSSLEHITTETNALVYELHQKVEQLKRTQKASSERLSKEFEKYRLDHYDVDEKILFLSHEVDMIRNEQSKYKDFPNFPDSSKQSLNDVKCETPENKFGNSLPVSERETSLKKENQISHSLHTARDNTSPDTEHETSLKTSNQIADSLQTDRNNTSPDIEHETSLKTTNQISDSLHTDRNNTWTCVPSYEDNTTIFPDFTTFDNDADVDTNTTICEHEGESPDIDDCNSLPSELKQAILADPDLKYILNDEVGSEESVLTKEMKKDTSDVRSIHSNESAKANSISIVQEDQASSEDEPLEFVNFKENIDNLESPTSKTEGTGNCPIDVAQVDNPTSNKDRKNAQGREMESLTSNKDRTNAQDRETESPITNTRRTWDCPTNVAQHLEMANLKKDKTVVQVMMEAFRDNSKESRLNGLNTVLCIDTSGSLKGKVCDQIKSTLFGFIDVIEEVAIWDGLEENIGVVIFGSSTKVSLSLTNDYGKVRETIESLSFDGTSPLHTALSLCHMEIKRNGSATCIHEYCIAPRIILISDGRVTRDELMNVHDVEYAHKDPEKVEDVLEYVKTLSALGYQLFTVGTGRQVNKDFMERISYLGGGRYFELDNISYLTKYFRYQEPKMQFDQVSDVVHVSLYIVGSIIHSCRESGMEHDPKSYLQRTLEADKHKVEHDDIDIILDLLEQSQELSDEEEPGLPYLGSRVCLSSLSGETGTVVKHRNKGWIKIKLDTGGIFYHHFLMNGKNSEVTVTNQPKRISNESEDIGIGMMVKQEKTDDINMSTIYGIVYDKTESGLVKIRWNNGTRKRCKMNALTLHDFSLPYVTWEYQDGGNSAWKLFSYNDCDTLEKAYRQRSPNTSTAIINLFKSRYRLVYDKFLIRTADFQENEDENFLHIRRSH